jgi:hypothetical protein
MVNGDLFYIWSLALTFQIFVGRSRKTANKLREPRLSTCAHIDLCKNGLMLSAILRARFSIHF